MIHITDFNGDIIDFISKSDGAVTEAEHMINVEDKLETFDFTVLTSRTEHMQKRNRVIIEDKDGQYREFIIYNISSDLNGYTQVQTNASALEDIKTAKPVPPHKLDKHTVKQALEFALADTGWKVSDEAEWGGTRTTSWTGWHDRISILKQLETTYDMRLSFYVEVGSNKITNRYVSLNKVEPMFNGEEIVYGENMIDLKRTVDFSDIATALICLGPEDSETGKREIVEVKDDDAQAQFGLPYRYIWDIYEPQSNDEDMTKERLTTLGRTALNKRKQESISYDIDGIGLSASAGDMIRVKNEDFTPELYVDAEVVEVTTDLISGESTYKFGVIKEYTRDDVYARFNAMLGNLRERLNKVVKNTDSIISERLEEELKYVERYIEKSPTPPLNPKEGQLWLDTSHDGVAVLKRYENGEWIKSSVDDVKDIGGMTREETMYEALKERLTRNEVDYSEVFKRHGALVSEKHYHYVDEDTKNDLTNRYNALQQSYDDFKIAFNNINAEQPTIGLITTAISRAIEFEARLKEYNDSYYVARKSFDEVIGILQSQYSDEKFNEAMEEVASAIGGTFDGTNIVADIPNQEDLKALNESIKQYLNGEIDSLDGKLGKQIETVVNQAKDEFSVAIDSVEKKVDGIEVGGRNLVRYSTQKYLQIPNGYCTGIVEEEGKRALLFDRTNNILYLGGRESYLEKGKTYTFSFYAKASEELEFTRGIYINAGNSGFIPDTKITTDWERYSFTFTASNDDSVGIHMYPAIKNADGTYKSFYITDWQLEKGTVATDVTPAPEDIENDINNLTQEVTKNSSALNVLNDQINLKVDSSTVKQMLDDELNVVKSNVQTNQAELKLLSNQISSKVEKSEYTTDINGITQDISNTKSEVRQLSESVNSKITSVEQKFDELEIGGRNLVLNSNRLEESKDYLVAIYEMSEPWQPNVEYTITLKGDFAPDTRPGIWAAGTGTQIATLDYDEDRNLWFSVGSSRPSIALQRPKEMRVYAVQRVSGATRDSTVEWIKIEYGNIATDWTPSPEDYQTQIDNQDKILTKHETEIEQNKLGLNTKVSYTEMNGTNKTLEKLLTEFSQTADGFNFRIDSNGMIQDLTFDKNAFKLNSNLIEFNDGDVVIKDGVTTIKDAYIDKLFSKTAFIEQLKAVDIDLNRATITGGDSTNNIKLDHQSIMSYGTFTRSWGGETDTANLEIGLYDGQMRMRNLDTGYRLYLTERGLSTSMEGAIDELTSGTLEFHSQRFNKQSRGITMHSSYGTVAMLSDYSTAVIRSNLTANIESNEYSVYIRPQRLTRNGLNEFSFYVKGNDSTQETDGTLLFGDLTGANSSGSGLRFSKRRNLNTVYVTNINGDIGTGDISVKDAEIRGSIRTIGGLDVRTWDGTGYNQLRAGAYNSYNSLVFASHSGGHSYFGVASNEMRVTDNNGYNGGRTTYRDVRMGTLHTHGGFQNHSGASYVYFGVGSSTGLRITNNALYNGGNVGWRDIEFRNWKSNSHEKYKKDIKEWHTSVLDVFKNELQLYQYKYRDDLENNMLHRGIVLREDSANDKFPTEWRQGDGYNGNEVMWWNTKAIQELAHENDELKKRIEKLEELING